MHASPTELGAAPALRGPWKPLAASASGADRAGGRPAAQPRQRPWLDRFVPHQPPAFTVAGPRCTPSPLVFDSPHSWRHWPGGATATLATPAQLEACCDAWVNEIWAEAIDGIAPLLAARFHPAYIDADRARGDIDPDLLAEPWPGPCTTPAPRWQGGGLVRREALPGVPLYARPLQVLDVQQRIERCYDPYHASLASLLDDAHAAHGFALHIDCRSVGHLRAYHCRATAADLEVGDLGGRCAGGALLAWVAEALRDLGYCVAVNTPCPGAELLRRHSRPAEGRHGIRIAVRRSLYMHESPCERHAGCGTLIADLGHFVRRLRTALCGALGAQLQAHEFFPHHEE